MGIVEIIKVALAANAFEFALVKLGIVKFYGFRRPKGFPEWCEFCCFFWFGVLYCFHDWQFIGLMWTVFYGLCIAQVARIIHLIYIRLTS